MVYNVNLCVNLCKQIGVLATLFSSKNQYDFAFVKPPLSFFSVLSGLNAKNAKQNAKQNAKGTLREPLIYASKTIS
jgi:hypothetical protein